MKKMLFEFFYFTGLARVAWHHDEVTPALTTAVESGWLQPHHRVLEVGCGLGTNCEWLATQGFDVTGIDLSSMAIRKANRRLRRNKLQAKLYQRDFLQGLDEEPFDLVVDRATLHAFPAGEMRDRFAQNLASLVKPGGSLLLIEMERGKQRPKMPPFAIQRADLETMFGAPFHVDRFGEEVQHNPRLGELVFGQWRVSRPDTSV